MTGDILIIDDDELVRGTIADNLRDAGYVVSTARDGAAALDMLAAGLPPAVVVTDIIMPNKEGLETILDLRSRFPQVRVVAISGGGRQRGGNLLDLAGKMGADAVLAKPLDIDLLVRTIRDMLAPA